MRIISDEKSEEWKSIYVEDLDDLWYLRNIIRKGDAIRMTVMRRLEKQDDINRLKEQSRKPVTLTIRTDEVEFQEFVDRLKVLGTIVSENENLRGEHQSFLISPGTTFDLRYHRSSRSSTYMLFHSSLFSSDSILISQLLLSYSYNNGC